MNIFSSRTCNFSANLALVAAALFMLPSGPSNAQIYGQPDDGYLMQAPDNGPYYSPHRSGPYRETRPYFGPEDPPYGPDPLPHHKYQIAKVCLTYVGQCELPGPMFVGRGCGCYFDGYGTVRGSSR